MKQIGISADSNMVSFDGQAYSSSCLVRTSANGLRPTHVASQVHLSTNADGSDGKPVMPKVYPTGTWNVIDVHPMVNPNTDLGPIVVRTDAHQILRVWALDANGGYDHETDEEVMDWGYEIHYCDPIQFGIYTVGCVHISQKSDIIAFANAVQAALVEGPIQVVSA